MNRTWILIALAGMTLVPFIINAFGHGIYLYFTFGSRDLVVAASQGVSHNTISEHHPYRPASSDIVTTLIYTGPIHLFTERHGEFRPYRFHIMTSANYFGVEFPWVLIPLTCGVLAAWRWRRSINQRLTLTGDECDG